MSITAPDARITEYSPVVATTTFPATFPVFDNSDLTVIHDGVERSDFTVTASYVDGISDDARAVFSSGLTGQVVVVGRRLPRRSSRFREGAPLPTRDQNLALDTLSAEAQEARRDIGRSLKVRLGEAPQDLPTPDNVSLLGWDKNGKLINRVGAGESAEAALSAAEAALAAANGNFAFDTVVDAIIAAINPVINTVRVNGKMSRGDFYGGSFRSTLLEPDVPDSNKFQSSNGRWFERRSADLGFSPFRSSLIVSPEIRPGFPDTPGMNMSVVIAPGSNIIDDTVQINRSVIIAVKGPAEAVAIDRAEIFGNQAAEFMRYGERFVAIGSNAYQWPGANNVDQLHGETPHAYWRDKLTGSAPYNLGPGDPTAASIVSGGSGYLVGDQITLTGGTATTAMVVQVTSVAAGGVVTGISVGTPGVFTKYPTNPTAQGGTTGAGSGATFRVIYWDFGATDNSGGYRNQNGMETRNPGIGQRIKDAAINANYAAASDDTGRSVAICRDAMGTPWRADRNNAIGYRSQAGAITAGLNTIGTDTFKQSAFLTYAEAVGDSAGIFAQDGTLFSLIGSFSAKDASRINRSMVLSAYGGSGWSDLYGDILIGYAAGQRGAISDGDVIALRNALVISNDRLSVKNPAILANLAEGRVAINSPLSLNGNDAPILSGMFHVFAFGQGATTELFRVFDSGAIYVANNGLFGRTSSSQTTVGAGTIVAASGEYVSLMAGTAANQHMTFRNNAAVTPAAVGSIVSSGSATSYNTSSDQTWKDDDGEFTFEQAYEILALIELHNYTWNDRSPAPGTKGRGAFAQQLFEVYPDAVTPGGLVDHGDGEFEYRPWSIDNSKLVPVVAAVAKGLALTVKATAARLEAIEEWRNAA